MWGEVGSCLAGVLLGGVLLEDGSDDVPVAPALHLHRESGQDGLMTHDVNIPDVHFYIKLSWDGASALLQ